MNTVLFAENMFAECVKKDTYHFASPVIRIWIKHEIRLICKGPVEDEDKGENCQHGEELEPHDTSGSFMIRREGQKCQRDQQNDFNLLTENHGSMM